MISSPEQDLNILFIHYCHIAHNTLYLPPNILHNHCLFFLGSTVIPRETEDNDYVFFFHGGDTHGVLRVFFHIIEWRKAFKSLVFGFVELIW